MSTDFSSRYIHDDKLPLRDTGENQSRIDQLPDGRDALVFGQIERYREFCHPCGDNPYGYWGTGSLVACEDILHEFEHDTSELKVLDYAIRHGLCLSEGEAIYRGGVTISDQNQVLNDLGVAAHIENIDSLEDLGNYIEQGSGVLILANAGIIWDNGLYYDHGRANLSLVVIGIARDLDTGEIRGAYVNDNATGRGGLFISARTLFTAWLQAGGVCIVTDDLHRG